MSKEYTEEQKKLAGKLKESLTRSEFEQLALMVAKKIKSIEQKNVSDIEMIKKALDGFASSKLTTAEKQLKEALNIHLSGSSETIKEKMAELDARISTIKDGMDGKDADEEKIVEEVLSKIKLPEIPSIEEDLPKMGERIRDALELLQEDNRLTAESVSGLKKLIKKMINEYDRKKVTPLAGVATFNPDSFNIHVIEQELVGTGDGSTTEFPLNQVPSPASSLHIHVGTAKMFLTDDFTLSGKTITFLTAPPTGAKIRADYRV